MENISTTIDNEKEKEQWVNYPINLKKEIARKELEVIQRALEMAKMKKTEVYKFIEGKGYKNRFAPTRKIKSIFKEFPELIKEFDDTLTMIDDGDAIGNQEFHNTPLVAAVDQYYTTSMFNFKDGFNTVISKDKDGIL